ncbi:hypothetical protein SD70_01485 [Gordoniibacillus kamchatkensis]|uniref:ABC transmembrane type-1 domain-containing protein n=1 Tax=Gordoniibacillus kamchatkensis TaxID=1590651 RepID=A0ABR5AN56_9BACL|nr:sugar ABC transporter permease [Paenibacillus sp. VKM B-2647]KIL42243.1 hypothetical protein SD70_01485 [Paenibacillus sp. VKM B-2647]
MGWRLQYKLAPYVFIAPFFILLALFTMIPFLFSVYISFTDWQGSADARWVGLNNYGKLFYSRIFWESVQNSLIIFLLYVPAMLLLALLLAVALNQPWLPGKGMLRTAFVVPNITSVIAVSFVFVLLLNTNDGIVNHLLLGLHVVKQPIRFLDTPFWARISVAFIVLFRWVGYNMLLLLAGLQTVPRELYEAAKVDGARPAAIFFKITVPMLNKVLLFCTVLSTIGTFSLFVEPYIVAKGGPMNATTTPILLLFRESFENFHFGYASAISVAFLLLMALLTLLQLKLFSGRGE